MTAPEEDLAKAAAQGDGAAFSALLDRVYDRLFALCFRLTGQRAEAEDLTQDICLALPGKLASYRGEARVMTWLYRIAVNAAHDRRRRAETHARHAAAWGEVELARRAEADEAAAAEAWLAEAMAALPETLRETLAVVLDAGLTQAEAAAVLGVKEGTIAWRMSEIRKALSAQKETAG